MAYTGVIRLGAILIGTLQSLLVNRISLSGWATVYIDHNDG